ncbi:MAG: efflux RND transporter periplasmic adaptor subunit, partial [Candidatus Zixiibacteriota bacterium]
YLMAGCGGGNNDANTSERPAVTVVTDEITTEDFPVTVRIGGTLKGDRQTLIPAKVTSTVSQIPARRGRTVRKNELLVMLDPGGVTSRYRQALAVYLNSEKQYSKMRSLYETGAISESQLDRAETEYKVAKADYEAAAQTIEIRAPFDGVVTDVHVRGGDEVSLGTPLVEVADVAALRLFLEVPTSQIGKLAVDQKVSVVSPIDSATVMDGKIIAIADAANTVTRSFEVECRFDNLPKGFAPGMYVIADIQTKILALALVIPNDAILYRSGEALVYLVDSDTVSLVPVNILASGDGRSAVMAEISPSQRVVVVGQKNLTPGARVREASL